jgi:hypothetical protein
MNNHLSPLLNLLKAKKNTTTYDVGNPDHGLGQAQKWGGVKLINGIPTLPS